MLVLSRRVGETVVIEGDICVTVVAVQGNRVRLGITAPAAVRVDRQEVHQHRGQFDAPEPSLAGLTSLARALAGPDSRLDRRANEIQVP